MAFCKEEDYHAGSTVETTGLSHYYSLGDIAEISCEIGKLSTYFFPQNGWGWSCPYLLHLGKNSVLRA